jgi:hypothetical protein
MPTTISIAMIEATTQSTAEPNGGHHRVPETYCLRCCQASLTPWVASPNARSHAGCRFIPSLGVDLGDDNYAAAR